MPRRIHAPGAHAPQGGGAEALRSIFGRSFTIISLVNLLIMTAYYVMFVTSTIHARDTYGASLSVAGSMGGSMVIGCLAGRFLSGSLLAVLGCGRVLFAGLLLFILSSAGFFLVHSLPAMMFQRLLTGFFVGAVGTATGSAVARLVPQEHHGLGIGVFSMGTALALGLGPFLGMLIAGNAEYSAVTWTAVGMGAAALLAAAALRGLPEMHQRHHRPARDPLSYVDPRVARFSLVALVAAFSYGCLQAFIPTFAQERGLEGPASLFFLLYAAAAMSTRPLFGRRLDLLGENSVIRPTLLLTALSLILLAHASNAVEILAAGILFGVGFGNFQSAGQAVALSLVTRSRIPQATTTFFVLLDLGIGIGPWLFGRLVPVVGHGGMCLCLAFTALGALLLHRILRGGRADR